MTILMVNKFHYLRGGAERYVFDLTRLLERQGHRVIPFATRHPANVPSEFAADFIPGPDFDAPQGPGAALAAAGEGEQVVDTTARLRGRPSRGRRGTTAHKRIACSRSSRDTRRFTA